MTVILCVAQTEGSDIRPCMFSDYMACSSNAGHPVTQCVTTVHEEELLQAVAVPAKISGIAAPQAMSRGF